MGKSGAEATGKTLFLKVNVQMAFIASHSVMESCYLSAVKIHWRTLLKSFVTMLFPARTGTVPEYQDSDSKN